MSLKNQYLVTTYLGQAKRSQVWDSSCPLPLDSQFQWVLEKGSPGEHEPKFQIRHLNSTQASLKSKLVTPLIQTKDEHHAWWEDTTKKIRIELRTLKKIPPAYLSTHSAQTDTQLHLSVFIGSGRALVRHQSVHSAFIAYYRKNPVFILQTSSGNLYEIKPLLPGVQLKLKSKEPMLGKIGDSWKLSASQLCECTVTRSSRWWRFQLSAEPAPLPSKLQLSGNYRYPSDQQENSSFQRILATLISLALAGTFCLLKIAPDYFSSKNIKNIPMEEPPIVKFVIPKPKITFKPVPIPAPQIPAATKPTPTAPVPKEKPKPETPTQPKETPKPAMTTPKPPAPAPARPMPPTPAKPSAEELAKKQSQAKLASLKAALGSALTFTQKANEPLKSGSFDQPQAFKLKSSTLNPTQIDTHYSTSSTQIQPMGSGETHGGYSSSELTSQGLRSSGLTNSSFVELQNRDVMVEKGLLQEEVGEVIHKHLQEIRYCHESAMLSHPNLGGKLVVQFKIDPNGKVEKADIQSSTLGIPSLEHCIINKLVTWQFPRPKGGIHVEVSYPFVFKVLERE